MSEVVYPFWIGLSALERAGAEAPRIYLDYLADALVAAVDGLDETETDHWRGWFRRNADELGMAAGVPAGLHFTEEIRSVLSPDNEAAKAWARACIKVGLVHGADPKDPESVISRLSWPLPPGSRAGTIEKLDRTMIWLAALMPLPSNRRAKDPIGRVSQSSPRCSPPSPASGSQTYVP